MSLMPLLHRKGVLAIAAVIDIAMHGRSRPVSEAERAFSAALSRINIDDMAKAAEALK